MVQTEGQALTTLSEPSGSLSLPVRASVSPSSDPLDGFELLVEDKERMKALRLHEVTTEVLSWTPRIFMLHNLLTDEECDKLMELSRRARGARAAAAAQQIPVTLQFTRLLPTARGRRLQLLIAAAAVPPCRSSAQGEPRGELCGGRLDGRGRLQLGAARLTPTNFPRLKWQHAASSRAASRLSRSTVPPVRGYPAPGPHELRDLPHGRHGPHLDAHHRQGFAHCDASGGEPGGDAGPQARAL